MQSLIPSAIIAAIWGVLRLFSWPLFYHRSPLFLHSFDIITGNLRFRGNDIFFERILGEKVSICTEGEYFGHERSFYG